MKKSYHSMAVPKQLANTTFLYPSCPPDRAATCGSWRRAVVGCISPLSVGTTREANPERTSEWIPGWTVLDRDPLPLGELLPIGRPADPPTVAGGAAAAKRDVRFVMHRLIVDVQQARIESVADRHRATDGARDDRGREPILRLVGEPDRFVVGRERRHRCNRAEDFLFESPHAWLDVVDHRGLVKQLVEGAAGRELRPGVGVVEHDQRVLAAAVEPVKATIAMLESVQIA